MASTLRINNLWKCYAAGVRGCSARVWALRGCSLNVQAGERVAIAGRPGSGKSTILQCIAGLRPVDSGRVQCDFASVVYLTGLPVPQVRRPANTLYLIDDIAFMGEREPRQLLDEQFHPSSALIIAARHVTHIAPLVQRIYTLREGRLDMLPRTPVRRVAEPRDVMRLPSFDTRESSGPEIGRA